LLRRFAPGNDEKELDMVDRVEITDKAAEVVTTLKAIHGALMFHQSGGCCDGSAAQFEYWQHTQLIIDAVPGRGSGFSLEAPEGVRFLTRSRVFTDAEVSELKAAGPPSRAA
jgi:uncharacterized protein